MKNFLLLTTVLFSISSASFAANLQSLNKSQVSKEFKGNTLTTVPLTTLDAQLHPNALTAYFDNEGKMRGRFETQPANGPQFDEGTWTVKADGALCATWQNWNNKAPICVMVYKLPNALVLVNQANKKFETMVLIDNIKSGNQVS